MEPTALEPVRTARFQSDLNIANALQSAEETPTGDVPGRKRPSPRSEAVELCNSQLLKISYVGGDQQRTPRSIAITAGENRVMRLPDSGLMFKQQKNLQDMLADIHEVLPGPVPPYIVLSITLLFCGLT